MLDHTFFDSLSRLQLKMPHKSSLNSSGSHRSLRKGSRNYGGESSYTAPMPAAAPDYSSTEDVAMDTGSYSGASPFSKY